MKPSPLIAVFSFAAFIAIAWDVLFYQHAPGISVVIYWAIVLGGYSLFDRFTHRFMSSREIAIGASILVLASFFAIRASTFLHMLDAVAIAYLFFLFIVHSMGMHVRAYRLFDYLLFLPFEALGGWLQRFDAFRDRESMPRGYWMSARVWLGIAGALVFVLVFVGLFASADAVFAKYVADLVNWEVVRKALGHAVVIVAVFVGWVPLIAAAFWKRPTPREIQELGHIPGRGVESSIVLVASNIVFALFLFVQFKFLFAGKGDFAAFDLTYAQYARQGFFQLLLVALIVACMTWFVRRLSEGRLTIAVKTLQTVLVAQTFVVLASSWMRLALYEEGYGFTHMRLFSHYFLIVVAILLVILLMRLFNLVKDAPALHAILYVFVIGLVGLNIINPDALIARQNLNRGTAVVAVDRNYLLDLSDDAAPEIVPMLERDLSIVPTDVKDLLKQSIEIEERIHQTRRDYDSGRPEVGDTLSTQYQRRSDVNVRLNHRGFGQLDSELVRYMVRRSASDDWQSWNWPRREARELRNRLRISIGLPAM